MNKDELRKTIKYLENLPGEQFGMTFYAEEYSCGTVVCIAGAVCTCHGLLKEFDFSRNSFNGTKWSDSLKDGRDIAEVARKILGLTTRQASWLFLGEFSKKSLTLITKEEAINAVKHLLGGGGLHTLAFMPKEK